MDHGTKALIAQEVTGDLRDRVFIMRNTIDPAFAEQIGMTMIGHRHADTMVLSAAAEAVLASYEGRATSYSRNKTFYRGTSAVDPAFTHEYVTRGIDHLADLGMVETTLGRYRTGIQSTFWATPRLVETGAKACRILRRQTDCIVQKDRQKRLEPYDRNPEILAFRKATIEWTDAVRAADIRVDAADITWTSDGRVEIPNATRDGNSIFIHTGDFAFYRVFNNSSLEQGGRAYGHFCQSLPGLRRRQILIDGKVVALLDFSASHPRMAYARAGIPYPADRDPYGVPGIDRETAKLAFLIVLNAVSRRQGVEALAGKLAGADQQITAEHQQAARRILAAMEAAHEPIRSQFYKGTGLQCQFVEAMILSEVAKEARRENIVTLPVHDEMIVQAQHAGRVHELMLKHWHQQIRRQFGTEIRVEPVIK